MKNFISAILFTAFIFVGGVLPSHASSVIGAIEPTQIANNIELVPINISTAANALSTQLMQVKQTILDPLANTLIVISQLQTANGVINLVNGGFQGNSLIPGDPRSYVDNKGLEIVKIGLGVVANQRGPYSPSLLTSLTNNFRNSSFTNQLQAVNQSSVPKTVQKSACDDAMLTKLANDDVLANNKADVIDPALIMKRKKELYEALCVGDPSTNPALASTLNKLNSARPDVGGWDSWLAVTGGENDYSKTVQTNELIAAEKARVEAEATNDLNRGRGVASQTKCLIRADKDINGQPYVNPESAPCLSQTIMNPSGLLQDSLSKATNAGLDRLGNIQGFGSLIQSLTSIINLSNGIRSFGTSVSNVLNAGANGAGPSVYGGANNSSSPVVSPASVNDLTNNPDQKATVVDPIKKLLANDSSTIADLKATDQTILSDLKVYEARLNEVKSCYSQVAPGDPVAVALFENRDTVISTLRTKIADDLSKIVSGEKLIQDTLNTLNSSQSTNAIMNTFFAYQKAEGSLPDLRTLAQRKSDYTQNKSKSTSDLSDKGELTQLNNRCVQLLSQQSSRP